MTENKATKNRRFTPRRRKVDKKLDKAYQGIRETRDITEMLEDVERLVDEL